MIPGMVAGMQASGLEADTALSRSRPPRWGVRINTISAGPYASRAASAIGFIDTMIKYCQDNSTPDSRARRQATSVTPRLPASPSPRPSPAAPLCRQRLPRHGHGRPFTAAE